MNFNQQQLHATVFHDGVGGLDGTDLDKQTAIIAANSGMYEEVKDHKNGITYYKHKDATIVNANERNLKYSNGETPLYQKLLSEMKVEDANSAIGLLATTLTFIEQRAIKRLYNPISVFSNMVPFEGGTPVGAEFVVQQTLDIAGQGRRIAPGANEQGGRISVSLTGDTRKVHDGSLYCEYTVQDLERAAFTGIPLESWNMDAMIDAYGRHMNTSLLLGAAAAVSLGYDFNEDPNFQGFFTNNRSTAFTLQTAGLWTTKSPYQVFDDINQFLNAIWTNSGYQDQPDLMPNVVLFPAKYVSVLARPMTINTSGGAGTSGAQDSILEYFKKNNIYTMQTGRPIDIRPHYFLDTLGAAGTGRLIAYSNSDKVVVGKDIKRIQFLAPQFVGNAVKIIGNYRYTEIWLRQPPATGRLDGI